MITKPANDPLGQQLEALYQELRALRDAVGQRAEEHLRRAHSTAGRSASPSARNLAVYLALREHDLQPLQAQLAAVGLSSLGRSESDVLGNIDAVLDVLSRATGQAGTVDGLRWQYGNDPFSRLTRRSHALFGKPSRRRKESIMVTLPSEAAEDARLVEELLANGMDCARINCAHDDPAAWRAMIDRLRSASSHLGRPCRLLMDLAGHKIRTGPLDSDDPVLHLHPRRDRKGHSRHPAEVLLVSEQTLRFGSRTARPRIPLPENLLSQLATGGTLHFEDLRGKQRHLEVVAREGRYWVARIRQSAYIRPGTELRWEPPGKASPASHRVGDFPGETIRIRLFRGDQLRLSGDGRAGQAAQLDSDGQVLEPAHISCSRPEVLAWLEPGHSVWFDDGKLGCRVLEVDQRGALLKVTEAGERGVRLRADKGINLPDTTLALPPLTAEDEANLEFICEHADMVGFSFVQSSADMAHLRAALADAGRGDLPIIAKIETAQAVRNLPDILLGSMDEQRIGVMIARGDLAVELGSVRMAETQEDILWLCQAADIPVIWATQVLESLAKHGISSRPEITDAAMSVRADCVMLNKGSYIVDALRVLSDILSRMDRHQRKKTSKLCAIYG